MTHSPPALLSSEEFTSLLEVSKADSNAISPNYIGNALLLWIMHYDLVCLG